MVSKSTLGMRQAGGSHVAVQWDGMACDVLSAAACCTYSALDRTGGWVGCVALRLHCFAICLSVLLSVCLFSLIYATHRLLVD